MVMPSQMGNIGVGRIANFSFVQHENGTWLYIVRMPVTFRCIELPLSQSGRSFEGRIAGGYTCAERSAGAGVATRSAFG
jgi:hypothetical protein